MGKICILHLSDLHISDQQNSDFDRARESLLEDVNHLLNNTMQIIDAVVVTGDIVDRGGAGDSYSIAYDFFTSLLNSLKIRSDRLIIVPGNHDIQRGKPYNAIISDIDLPELNDTDLSKRYWNSISPRFDKFYKFIERLNGSMYDNKLFGGTCKDLETDAGIIRFILLNSAWSSIGDNDYKNLLICQKQLEDIKNQINNLPPAKLTLALTHHPLDWFNINDQEILNDFLFEKKYIPIDVMLHGHTHNTNIESYSDPDTTRFFMETGIGYPDITLREKGRPKLSGCRYSLYVFDLNTSMVSIWLRISNAKGEFSADTQKYKAGKEDGHVQFPFKRLEKIDATSDSVYQIELDPIPITNDWVGRDEEIAYLLDHKYRAVAITGVGGQGKSALAAEFIRRHTSRVNAVYDIGVFVDCREVSDTIHVKLIELLEALSLGKETAQLYRDERIDATAKRLLVHLQARKYIIVFDNIDAYVKADTESFSPQLKPILDVILNNEHQSLVIFTCRPSLNDARGSFYSLQLKGLSEEECIELFKKRRVGLIGENAASYCKELVQLTNGHPWWLGLIAGQVVSRKETIKSAVDKFSRGEAIGSEAIKEYFKDIWKKQIKKKDQDVFRYLVEAPRPLNDSEITKAVQEPINNIRRALKRLCRLGLLERHELALRNLPSYQVHPLVREYVHETYTPEKQKQYVYRILYIFLPTQMIKGLFSSDSILGKNYSLNPINICDSIETCLISGHYAQALKLLEAYGGLISDLGYNHRFIYLTCRLLDAISWDKEGIVERTSGNKLLSEIIWRLALHNDYERTDEYLRQYEMTVVQNTVSHLHYLNIKAYMDWMLDDYEGALNTITIYEDISKKLNVDPNCKFDILNTKALALRDLGHFKIAIPIFHKESSDSKETMLGNCARCLMMIGDYKGAENLLRQSVLLLKTNETYMAGTNLGYAYLWLSELKYQQDQIYECSAFMALCQATWGKYAPGCLPKLDILEEKLFITTTKPIVSINDAYLIESQFLKMAGGEESLLAYLQ